MARTDGLPGQTAPARRASGAGALTAGLLAVAIYFGSDRLRNFDAALIGYATATVVLTFGVVYRYAMWIQQAPTRRYLVRGWRAFLSWRNFRRFPTLVPKELVSYLGLQLFLRQRSRARWLAQLAIFWGVVLAALMTFALSWGWIHFEADQAGTYQQVSPPCGAGRCAVIGGHLDVEPTLRLKESFTATP